MTKNNILSACLMGASLLCTGALTSCGDQFQEEYPWMVGRQEDQDSEDESSAGRYDMEILERELKGALPFMINYSHAPDNSWAPHNYQYNRANNIDNYCGYWTTSKGTFGFGGNLPTLYTYPNDYLGGPADNSIFAQSYDAIHYATDMVDQEGNPVGSKPYWRACALIIQSYTAMNVVDAYGACPLNDWRNRERNKTVQWEAGHDVYKQIVEDLNEAIATLKATTPAKGELDKIELDPTKEITIFRGDWKNWVKFANCMKLRMAMNLSRNFDGEARALAEEALNDEIGVLTEADPYDIAYYYHNNNSWYFISQTWGDIRLNANLESIMKHFNNPLLGVWFDTLGATVKDKLTGVSTSGEIAGMRAGIDMVGKNAGGRTDGAYGSFSCFAFQDFPMPFFKRTESLFLQAEANLRWGIGSRSVKELYEAGITLSMTENGVESGLIAEYLEQSGDMPAYDYVDFRDGQNNINGRVTCDVKWNEGDSKELKLEKLITQKYIAVFPQGDAAWNDFRRTGYPRLFPPKTNGGMPGMDGKLELQIRRIPQKVVTNNTTEMAGLSAVLGFDQKDASQPIFWDIPYEQRQWGDIDPTSGLETPEPMPVPVNF